MYKIRRSTLLLRVDRVCPDQPKCTRFFTNRLALPRDLPYCTNPYPNPNPVLCVILRCLDVFTGDVVFANSTCFDDDLMRKLALGVAALKEGAIVVTTTDPVPSSAFEVLEEVQHATVGVP